MNNSWNKNFFLVLTFLISLHSLGVDLPRPVFNEKKEFVLQSPQAAIELKPLPIKVLVFNEALKTCKTTSEILRNELSQLLNPQESIMISALKKLYPDLSLNQFSKLQILIDSFDSKNLRGFYLPDQGQTHSTISLDCTTASRLSWASLLSHEMVHHLNKDQNIASWLDEMLAQMMETQASLIFPYQRVNTLKNLSQFPSFFARAKTFSSTEEYAINLLFGVYISRNFGGFTVFQSLHKDIQSIDEFANALRQKIENQSQYDWIKDYVTARGLIRHFSLAMNINSPTLNKGGIYEVPGWSGFSKDALIRKSGTYPIEQGGFLRLDSKLTEALSQMSEDSDFEIYRILKNGQTFKIQKITDPVSQNWDENFLVLINFGAQTQIELSESRI